MELGWEFRRDLEEDGERHDENNVWSKALEEEECLGFDAKVGRDLGSWLLKTMVLGMGMC